MLSKMILGSALLIANFRAGESAQEAERVEPGHPHYHLRNAGEPDHPDGGAPVGEPDHPDAGPDESSNLADQQQAVEGGDDEKEVAPRPFPHSHLLGEIYELYNMFKRYYQGHPKLADINRRHQVFDKSIDDMIAQATNAEGTQPGAALAFDYNACARQLRKEKTEIKADRHLLLRQLVIRYLCEEPGFGVLSGETDMESHIVYQFEKLDIKIDDILENRMTYVGERIMYLETCRALKRLSTRDYHGKGRAITIKFVDLLERRARKLMSRNIIPRIIRESQNDGDTCEALVLALEECYVCIHEGRKSDLQQAVMTQLVIAKTHITSGYTQARRSDLSRAQSRMKPLH